MTATRPGPAPSGGPVHIPYGRQVVDDEDVAAVVAVLRSDRLTQGPAIEAFEAALVAATGAAHAVAFSSGTAALHAACVAAGLGPGDRVATSTLSFVASANCARYVGAEPVLVDVDPDTLNLDSSRLPAGLEGLVAVHFAGLPVDLTALRHRPRVVIEDAAHALGAATPDGPVGNCARSDLCCFSFHPVKAITTGEGGAVTTNDLGLADRLRRVRNHGMVPQPDAGGWAYDVVELGWNYRMTDIQAALGASQCRRLDGFIDRRNELAATYRRLLPPGPLVLPPAGAPGWRHAYHLFPVQVPDRRRVYDGMRAAEIGVQVHYVPIHRHSLYGRRPDEDFPVASRVSDHLLSLPLHPALEEHEQTRVVETLAALL